MTTEAIAPAILEYLNHNTYPDSESIASADLDPTTLQSLSQSLRDAQDHVKTELRGISRGASGDIDTWIVRAKELQADILRSRDTARSIVEEAEKGREIRDKTEDRKRKVELLEREVEFQADVQARLEHVGASRTLLGQVRDEIVSGNVVDALKRLEETEESINGLGVDVNGGVGAVLSGSLENLRQKLNEEVQQQWEQRVVVDIEARKVTIKDDGFEDLVTAAQGLKVFDGFVLKFGRDFEKAILWPRMTVDRSGRTSTIQSSASQVSCDGATEKTTIASLLNDLRSIFEFLAKYLPTSVSTPLLGTMLPPTLSRLEEEWLQPVIPIEISEMSSFQDVLENVSGLADKIEELGWHGDQPLREWIRDAPRSWLTKRREVLLGDVRNLVFSSLGETRTVERVETQMVRNDEAIAQSVGEDNEWDTAWDDPEETANAPIETQQPPTSTGDDDDDAANAWNVEEEDADAPATEGTNDDEEAWGWGDGDAKQDSQPSSPQKADHPPRPGKGKEPLQDSAEKQVTLREVFTVTAVPDGILELIQQIVKDAENLAEPDHAASPIAPVATALYTLPTLALAIYRATAPTAYAKLATGNMLIYNDASRLSDQLRAWQASQPPSSRLRLDNDVKALDQFAKRAYSTEMESQRTILRDLLDGAEGFAKCNTYPQKQQCEAAVEQASDRLRDVYAQWQPVLSNSALLQSLGSLLATITGKLIADIEDLPDIGEAESQQLKALCDRVSTNKDLFVQQAGGPDGETRDMTFIYCPNWLKLQYLAEIMESSLADLRYLWKEGELSLEFGAEEVVGLVEALFAESQLRRQAIQEVRRGARG